MPISFLVFLFVLFPIFPFQKKGTYSFQINKNSIYFNSFPVKKQISQSNNLLLFTKVAKDKFQIIKKKLENIGIFEKDLEESFIKGSGNGGQKINKTNNCVMLKFSPYNIVIRCQNHRCLQQNRICAREILYNRVISIKEKAEQEIVSQIENEKRRILKPTEKEKNESINYKRRKSQIKKERQKPSNFDI